MSKEAKSEVRDLRIYRGLTLNEGALPTLEEQKEHLSRIPPPPPWRTFGLSPDKWKAEVEENLKKDNSPSDPNDADIIDPRAKGFVASEKAIELVNAAICLRRPLLIEGNPGSGKTSLAYAVAAELGLPGPYRWSIVSRTRLKEGLYDYDAIGRLQEASLLRQKAGDKGEITPPDVGDYLRLGAMGMAFYMSKPGRPAVLLIDEIDKSDIDMPNDLLHIFEDGFFEIPELARLKSNSERVLPYRSQRQDSKEKIAIQKGFVQCEEFPLVFMTSNQVKEFPPAFLRRCIRLPLEQPDSEEGFLEILNNRLDRQKLQELNEPARELIQEFLDRIDRTDKTLASDQLLNAIYMLLQGKNLKDEKRKIVLDAIFKEI